MMLILMSIRYNVFIPSIKQLVTDKGWHYLGWAMMDPKDSHDQIHSTLSSRALLNVPGQVL